MTDELDVQVEYVPEIDIDIKGEDIELVLDEDEEDELADESTDEDVEDIEDDSESETDVLDSAQNAKDYKQVDNTTANAVIAERRKWQARMDAEKAKSAIADRLMSATGQTPEQIMAAMDLAEVENHVNSGMDEQTARVLVAQQRQNQLILQELSKQKFDLEAAKLKTNAFFADIDDVRDELEPYAIRTGSTLEQAYMAIRGNERMVDYEREIEQRVLNNLKKKPKKVDTGSSGDNRPKVKTNITADQEAFARAAGMTPQEFAAYGKGMDIDKARKVRSRFARKT